jgi:hypothetical protein
MKKPYLNHAIVAAALLGLAGFSGTTLSADDAAKKPEAAGEQKQAEQGKPDDKVQAKPGDTAQAKKTESGVKLQDYSKAGAYKDGKPVSGSTGQVAGDQPAADKGAAGPAAPAGDASKEAGAEKKPAAPEEKAGAEKKQ